MPGVRRSKRTIKKKEPFPDPSEQKSDSEESEEQSEQEPEQVIQPAVRTVQFRKKRGQKMNLLINKNKNDQDEDDFWKNNPYFGDNQHLSGDQEEEEQYVQSSSGRDEFDSDFLSSHSQKLVDKQDQQEEEVYVSEDESCGKRKRRNVQPVKPPTKKLKPSTTVTKPVALKYIHEQFTQQQLLAEAAHTQYFNYQSLQKLISLEQGKKIYNKKQHSLPPPKIVYRNRVEGQKSATTFSMVGFEEGVNFLNFKDPF